MLSIQFISQENTVADAKSDTSPDITQNYFHTIAFPAILETQKNVLIYQNVAAIGALATRVHSKQKSPKSQSPPQKSADESHSEESHK